jgi:hypothetical protein
VVELEDAVVQHVTIITGYSQPFFDRDAE